MIASFRTGVGRSVRTAHARRPRVEGLEGRTYFLVVNNDALDIYNGPPGELTVVGDTLFFTAGSSDGNALWQTDGTSAGTRMTQDVTDPAHIFRGSQLGAVGDRLAYSGGGQLYLAGPPEAALGSGSLYEGQFLPLGDVSVFVSITGIVRTDGTAAGTFPLVSVPSDAGMTVQQALVSRGVAYVLTQQFADGQPDRTLWRSDGTAEGTFPLAQFDMRGSFDGATANALAATPDGVTFVRTEYGNEVPLTRAQRWVSDGTVAGTVPVESLNPSLGSPQDRLGLPGSLFYAGGTAFTDAEFGRLAASPAGAPLDSRVALTGRIDPAQFTSAPDGTLYFTAEDAAHGRELWASDGTAAGTRVVADVVPGLGGSTPRDLTFFKGDLYFTAGFPGPAGRALWKLAAGAAEPERIEFHDAFFLVPSVTRNQSMQPSVRFRIQTEPDPGQPNRPGLPKIDISELVDHPEAVRVVAPDGTAYPVTLTDEFGGYYLTYELAAPGGAFDAADAGLYKVELAGGIVRNPAGELVAGRTIGRLDVDVATSGPDLVAGISSKVPTVVSLGKRVRVSVTIENRGDAVASGPVSVRLAMVDDGGTIRDDTVESVERFQLAPGQRKTLRVNWSTSARTEDSDTPRQFQTTVDAFSEIGETDEANNVTDGPVFQYLGNPQLGIAMGSAAMSPLPRGSTVRVPFVVSSGGNLPLRGRVSVYAYLSSDGFPSSNSREVGTPTRVAINLKPGAVKAGTIGIVIPADLAPGPYSLKLEMYAVEPLSVRWSEIVSAITVV